jgi:hypothetical protein
MNMPELDEILRNNPRAAAGIDAVREALDSMRKLREAGLAARPDVTSPTSTKKSLADLKAAEGRRIFQKAF